MKHLGGFGFDGRAIEMSVVPGSTPWDIHLWMATQEQREQCFVSPSEDASSAAKDHMGSVLTE